MSDKEARSVPRIIHAHVIAKISVAEKTEKSSRNYDVEGVRVLY